MCSFHVRTLTRAAPSGIGQDLPGLLDVHDELRPERDRGTELRDRRRRARVGLERIARPNPRVVAAVEQAHVVDAGVAQDQRRAAGGDLAGSTPRPLLVRVALRVAAVEDDGRVVRDSERAHGETELLRRPALPVDGVLELVGVEVERTGEVPFRVLLGDAEVDVEEQEASGRRRLRSVAVEHLGEPVAVHEPVVVRETLDGQSLVAGPVGPSGLVDAHPPVVEVGEPGSHGRNVCGVAVEDDLLVGDDTFLVKEPYDLGVVDARKPCAGKRDGSGNVPTSSSRPAASRCTHAGDERRRWSGRGPRGASAARRG